VAVVASVTGLEGVIGLLSEVALGFVVGVVVLSGMEGFGGVVGVMGFGSAVGSVGVVMQIADLQCSFISSSMAKVMGQALQL